MLVTGIFNREDRNYDQLLTVWERSAQEVMPGVPRKIIRLDPPVDTGREDDITYADATVMQWVLDNGEDCIVTDADIMFCGNMMDVFKKEFDIAVTTREYKSPYNSGVWYYRNTPGGRAFVESWISQTWRMWANEEKRAKPKHGGLDQASLAKAIKKTKSKVIEIPCSLYNAEQSCWGKLSPNVRAVHIKSKLRQVCFGEQGLDVPDRVHQIAEQWRSYL